MIAPRRLRTLSRSSERMRWFALRWSPRRSRVAPGAPRASGLLPLGLFWRQPRKAGAQHDQPAPTSPAAGASLPSINWVRQLVREEHHHHHIATRVEVRDAGPTAPGSAAPVAGAPLERPHRSTTLAHAALPVHFVQAHERYASPLAALARTARAARRVAPKPFAPIDAAGAHAAAAGRAPSSERPGAPATTLWARPLAVERRSPLRPTSAADGPSPLERPSLAAALHPRRSLARARLAPDTTETPDAIGVGAALPGPTRAWQGHQPLPSLALTWRSTSHAPSLEASSAASVAARQSAGGAPAVGAASVALRGATPATDDARAAARPAPALTPIEIDRLAEDVMRRIDRRLRIERERRGG